jgi:hypothetical protein
MSALTLYAVEMELAAYLDTEAMVPPEQEDQFVAELATAMINAKEKRDRVGQFLAHLDAQVEFADKEIERLRERKEAYARALERMEGYVACIIESLGQDERGKWRKLEGNTVTFSLRACPASVEIKDDAAVPVQYKTAAVRMPAKLWEEMLDALDLELRSQVEDLASTPNYSVSKTAIKKGIDAGEEVPGADLTVGKYSLVRK